jgi:hypothetical protein
MPARRAASALRDFRKLSRRRLAAPPPGFVFEVERERFDDEDDSDEDVARAVIAIERGSACPSLDPSLKPPDSRK